MFVDEVKVYARAGHGGKGCVAFQREAFRPKGGPSGGNGGRGGSVILEADHDLNNLIAQYYSPRLEAQNGHHGLGKGMDGHAGRNLVVKVPCGTLVWKLPDKEIVADLTQQGDQFVLCRGGRGGLGNRNFATSRNQTPRFAQPGEPGQEGEYLFELRLMAEVGLVGYPNAGKSTLLTAISRARPKIASYPFTTLHPQVGILEYADYARLTVCDVPGLVEGAHRNVGLGHAFLRHIQRCRVLVLLIDMAGIDGRLPWDDYAQLLRELELYDPALMAKPRLIVANKMDEPAASANLRKFKRRIPKTPVLTMAAAFDQGLDTFRDAIVAAVATAVPSVAPPTPSNR